MRESERAGLECHTWKGRSVADGQAARHEPARHLPLRGAVRMRVIALRLSVQHDIGALLALNGRQQCLVLASPHHCALRINRACLSVILPLIETRPSPFVPHQSQGFANPVLPETLLEALFCFSHTNTAINTKKEGIFNGGSAVIFAVCLAAPGLAHGWGRGVQA